MNKISAFFYNNGILQKNTKQFNINNSEMLTAKKLDGRTLVKKQKLWIKKNNYYCSIFTSLQ